MFLQNAKHSPAKSQPLSSARAATLPSAHPTRDTPNPLFIFFVLSFSRRVPPPAHLNHRPGHRRPPRPPPTLAEQARPPLISPALAPYPAHSASSTPHSACQQFRADVSLFSPPPLAMFATHGRRPRTPRHC